MDLTLGESRVFTNRVLELLDSESYRKMQNTLLDAPDSGDVMPGCGGMRKLRAPSPGRQKGKRGGSRIIYLHIPEASRIELITIYGKDERDGLTAGQKKLLRQMATEVREHAMRSLKA